jgi:alkylation response protein AidB-like acyl-CoA dehydrogenase
MCDPSANTSGFLDRCIALLVEHKLTTETASMIKYSATDMCGKVVDECLQLFGGYGYMWDYQFQECMLTIVLPGFMLELMKL